jgi:hypothetical protein
MRATTSGGRVGPSAHAIAVVARKLLPLFAPRRKRMFPQRTMWVIVETRRLPVFDRSNVFPAQRGQLRNPQAREHGKLHHRGIGLPGSIESSGRITLVRDSALRLPDPGVPWNGNTLGRVSPIRGIETHRTSQSKRWKPPVSLTFLKASAVSIRTVASHIQALFIASFPLRRQ